MAAKNVTSRDTESQKRSRILRSRKNHMADTLFLKNDKEASKRENCKFPFGKFRKRGDTFRKTSYASFPFLRC